MNFEKHMLASKGLAEPLHQGQGLLFVGHSENFTEHKDLFHLVGKTVYRRVGA